MAGKKSAAAVAAAAAAPSTPSKAKRSSKKAVEPAVSMDVDDTPPPPPPQDTTTTATSSARRRRSKKAKKPVDNSADPTTLSSSNEDEEMYRAVELKQVSGGTLTHDAIVFSSDSTLFFLAKDNAVAVYNVENAEMVQSIAVQHTGNKKQGDQAAATIHAIVADPDQTEDRRGVYTFSADSRARLWDADTGRLVSEWRLPGGAAVYAVADPTRSNAFYCAMRQPAAKNQRPNLDKAKYMISRITLAGDGSVQTEALFKMSGTVGLCVRGDSQWVAAYAKFRVVLAQVRGGGSQVVQHTWNMTERVSALAFHPAEPVLAVGDWRGRIVFWHCVDEQLLGAQPTIDRRVTRNAHHWHAHRVNTIAFAEAGTTMLSGGEEGVLVLWQLVTGARSFVPRLGSDVMGVAISPDQAHYAVTLRDNTVKVLAAATRTLVASLQGLTFADSNNSKTCMHPRLARALQPNAFTTGLVVHPTTHHVVLNGEPGHLQVYSALNDRHVVSVEVAAFNRTGGSSSGQSMQQPHVDLVQYSSDGAWMATVDSRPGGQSAECYLKLWKFDPVAQAYRLATRIDAPHVGGVSALAFQPPSRSGHPLLCVTTGRSDASLRIWELQARGTDHHFWVCRSTARYREQSPRAVAFSADGSTLAVAFGGAVTLWDPATCLTPAAVLVASAQTPALSGLAFVGESSYLAAWSSTRLDMWNLLTGSVWWTLAMPLLSVAVHPRAPLLAVAARQAPTAGPLDASLLLLSPESPNPLVALPHPAGVEALAFVPSTSTKRGGFAASKQLVDPLDHNLLVVLTPTGLLNVYGATDDDRKEPTVAPKPSSAAAVMSSATFANIFGKSSAASLSAPAGNNAATAGNAHVRQAMRLVRSAVQSAYVNAPYHVLPPVSALYDQFVTAQMHPATSDLPPALAEENGEDSVMADAEKDEAPAAALASRPATVDDLWSEASPDFIQSICSGFQARI